MKSKQISLTGESDYTGLKDEEIDFLVDATSEELYISVFPVGITISITEAEKLRNFLNEVLV